MYIYYVSIIYIYIHLHILHIHIRGAIHIDFVSFHAAREIEKRRFSFHSVRRRRGEEKKRDPTETCLVRNDSWRSAGGVLLRTHSGDFWSQVGYDDISPDSQSCYREYSIRRCWPTLAAGKPTKYHQIQTPKDRCCLA